MFYKRFSIRKNLYGSRPWPLGFPDRDIDARYCATRITGSTMLPKKLLVIPTLVNIYFDRGFSSMQLPVRCCWSFTTKKQLLLSHKTFQQPFFLILFCFCVSSITVALTLHQNISGQLILSHTSFPSHFRINTCSTNYHDVRYLLCSSTLSLFCQSLLEAPQCLLSSPCSI